MNKKVILISSLPILFFLAIGFALFLGLSEDKSLPSNLIGKIASKLPETTLPGYKAIPVDAITIPKIKIINFWASWCGPCRAEHPNIEELAKLDINVYGVNIKDD